jgi:medium-chain acyl-[acyl-carrier-protein] hydrolase
LVDSGSIAISGVGDGRVLDKWVPFRSENAEVQWRVFGFPHAGGNALFYRAWRKHMPPDIDFCPVELPGHGHRLDEVPFANWGALVTSLQAVLAPLLTVPFAFFGHSTGACIAFAAAQALRAAGSRPAVHLFVSGRPAPGRAVQEHRIRSFSDEDLLTALIRYGGTPAAVMEQTELIAAILPAVRADLALSQTLRPPAGARLSCPITVFGGADDTIDSPALQAWSDLTADAFRIRMFPGGHFYLSGAGEALVDEIVRELRHPAAVLAPRPSGAAI